MPKLIAEDGTELSYVYKKGFKSCLIFLHGVGSNKSIWRSYISHFHDMGYSCLAVDLRGQGKSKKVDVNIEDYIEDLKLILDKEKVKRIILVGQCTGANIALDFYHKYPKHIEKLILFSPYNKDTLKNSMIYFLNQAFYYPSKALRKIGVYRRRLTYIDYDVKRTMPDFLFPFLDTQGTPKYTYASIVNQFYNKELNYNVEIPSLVVVAAKDKVIDHKKVIANVKGKSMIKIALLKNISHLVIGSKHPSVFRVIEDFI